MLTTTRPQQLHASLNTPQPVKHTAPTHDKGEASFSVVPSITDVTQPRPQVSDHLARTSHTLAAIQQVLAVVSTKKPLYNIAPLPPDLATDIDTLATLA